MYTHLSQFHLFFNDFLQWQHNGQTLSSETHTVNGPRLRVSWVWQFIDSNSATLLLAASNMTYWPVFVVKYSPVFGMLHYQADMLSCTVSANFNTEYAIINSHKSSHKLTFLFRKTQGPVYATVCGRLSVGNGSRRIFWKSFSVCF